MRIGILLKELLLISRYVQYAVLYSIHIMDNIAPVPVMEKLVPERQASTVDRDIIGYCSAIAQARRMLKLGIIILEDFEKISQMPHLDVKGLMILPPYAEEAEINRKYFIRTRKIAEYLNHYCGAHITELSMGTSSDYTAAVEEGATIIRIGTALVGPRDYSGKKLEVSS